MNEATMREKLKKLREKAIELGFSVDNIYIQIGSDTVCTMGDAIPKVVGKHWKIDFDLVTEINIE